jgi:hypothetical protein
MPVQPEPSAEERGASDPNRDLGELWSFGLEVSQVMADRIVEMYRELPSILQGASGDLDTEMRRLRIDLERAVDLAVGVFDRMLALSRRVAGNGAGAPDDSGDNRVLVLRASPGGVGSGELWIQNRGESDEPAPALWCTDLRSAEAHVIPADWVEVTTIDTPIAARSSRSARLRVALASDTRTGTYHGLVLARDDPDLTFRVRVDVSDVVVDLPTTAVNPDNP